MLKEAFAEAAPALITGLFVSVIMPAAGALALRWAKSREWSRLIALDAIAAGVDQAWETMGREMKAAAADGHFKPQERARLRGVATQLAGEFAMSHGVNIAKTLGPYAIETAIKDVVQRRKAGGAGVQAGVAAAAPYQSAGFPADAPPFQVRQAALPVYKSPIPTGARGPVVNPSDLEGGR